MLGTHKPQKRRIALLARRIIGASSKTFRARDVLAVLCVCAGCFGDGVQNRVESRESLRVQQATGAATTVRRRER